MSLANYQCLQQQNRPCQKSVYKKRFPWNQLSFLSRKMICNNQNKTDFHQLWTFIIRISLTHWGRVTHIGICKLTIIGSGNGLSLGRRQVIIWTSARILLIGPLRTNFSQILIEIHTFSFKKMHLKMSSVKWHPYCPERWYTTTKIRLRFSPIVDIYYQNLLIAFTDWRRDPSIN